MSDEREAPAGPGGGYITRGRALELERQIAATEARFEERLEQLTREVRASRASHVDLLRGFAAAVMEVLRNELAGQAPAGTTPIRRSGGS